MLPRTPPICIFLCVLEIQSKVVFPRLQHESMNALLQICLLLNVKTSVKNSPPPQPYNPPAFREESAEAAFLLVRTRSNSPGSMLGLFHGLRVRVRLAKVAEQGKFRRGTAKEFQLEKFDNDASSIESIKTRCGLPWGLKTNK
jgi:hypothetical protein